MVRAITNNIINRAFRREPAAILTVVLITLQAALEAASIEGWTWATLGRAAVTALIGLLIRESVYSPRTRDADVLRAREEGFINAT